MNTPADLPPHNTTASPSCWDASLALGIAKTARGSVLKSKAHVGPLYVQKPFYPEGRELAHIYLLHPPGGMVSGDTLSISAHLGEHAAALITTPGAGRAYKARADKTLQQQNVRFDLARHATLEWLPLESIIYPDANTRMDTEVYLSEGARYIGWEVTSLGLPASQQPFSANSALTQHLNIYQNGRLALRERTVVQGNEGMYTGLSGLRSFPIVGTMVAGPFCGSESDDGLPGSPLLSDEAISHLRDRLESNESESPYLTGVTLNDHFLVVRYLGHCSEQARTVFTRCWHDIRPLLLSGRTACAPRIWAT